METSTIADLIASLEPSQEFTFPVNSSREFIRSFMFRPENLGKRWKMKSLDLVALGPWDKPARITTLIRLA